MGCAPGLPPLRSHTGAFGEGAGGRAAPCLPRCGLSDVTPPAPGGRRVPRPPGSAAPASPQEAAGRAAPQHLLPGLRLVDDADEMTPVCFDFIKYLKPQLKDWMIFLVSGAVLLITLLLLCLSISRAKVAFFSIWSLLLFFLYYDVENENRNYLMSTYRQGIA